MLGQQLAVMVEKLLQLGGALGISSQSAAAKLVAHRPGYVHRLAQRAVVDVANQLLGMLGGGLGQP